MASRISLLLVSTLACAAAQYITLTPNVASFPEKGGARFTGPQAPASSPTVNWELLSSPAYTVAAVHMALVPGTNKFLFAERSVSGTPKTAADFNYADRSMVSKVSVSNSFCAVTTPTYLGSLAVIGGSGGEAGMGYGTNKLRLYDYTSSSLTDSREVSGRWYGSACKMGNRRVMIMGGTNCCDGSPANDVIEIYDPALGTITTKKTDPVHQAAVDKNYYPLMAQLPSGDVLTFVDGIFRFIQQNGDYRKDASGNIVTGPAFPDPELSTQYPRTGTAVLLPFRHNAPLGYNQVDVMVMGGQFKSNNCDYSDNSKGTTNDPTKAVGLGSRMIYRTTISWTFTVTGTTRTPVYTIAAWTAEKAGVARIGGDSVLLANGDVVFVNGAQTGCMGLGGRHQFPSMWPAYYSTDAPAGQRVTLLPASTTARMYHSTAAATMDGKVLIAGCDVCEAGTFSYDQTFLSPNTAPGNNGRELRVELLTPPHQLATAPKINITAIAPNGVTDVTPAVAPNVRQISYGASFTITYIGAAPTGVTLMGSGAVTHSHNTNQRLVTLPITRTTVFTATAGRVTVTAPPTRDVLPPGFYLLTLLNNKVTGMSIWVRFV